LSSLIALRSAAQEIGDVGEVNAKTPSPKKMSDLAGGIAAAIWGTIGWMSRGTQMAQMVCHLGQ
jgi:hypothetical protein